MVCLLERGVIVSKIIAVVTDAIWKKGSIYYEV